MEMLEVLGRQELTTNLIGTRVGSSVQTARFCHRNSLEFSGVLFENFRLKGWDTVIGTDLDIVVVKEEF